MLVLGIPSGVKMHSAVFALHTMAAAKIVDVFLDTEEMPFALQEVMDIDKEACVRGELSARLCGYLRVPRAARYIQSVKAGSRTQSDTLAGVVADMRERMADAGDVLFCIGAGTTTMALKKNLRIQGSLLGVDVVQGESLLYADTDSKRLEELAQNQKLAVVVSPIGGQGFVFGRGNQQFTPDVLRRVQRDRVYILATGDKLAALSGRPLLVDTGSEDTNEMFYGYARVLTGYHTEVVYKIAQAL